MINIDSFHQAGDIPLDKTTWNELVRNSKTNTLFQTHEWFNCWWNNYGEDHKLIFLTATDDGEIIGFAPLMISQPYSGKTIIRFVGDANADYCDFVITRDHLAVIDSFISFLYKNAGSWTDISLINIPDTSNSHECLKTICETRRLNIHIKTPVPTPTLIVNKQRDNIPPSINKYSIRRHIRKLDKMGKLRFRHIRDTSKIFEHMPTFFNQHITRYELKRITSQFVNEKNRQFFMDLVSCFRDTDWLLFSVLELDDIPLAYHLGFDYDNKIFWYKPTFNINYGEFSPGTVLIKELIEYTFNSEKRELDFTIGDEPFKYRFCNTTRHNHNVVIYRGKLRYHASNARFKAVTMMRKLMEKIRHG